MDWEPPHVLRIIAHAAKWTEYLLEAGLTSYSPFGGAIWIMSGTVSPRTRMQLTDQPP
jgi:hypothetical protein